MEKEPSSGKPEKTSGQLEEAQSRKTLIIFVSVVTVLGAIGGYVHLNSDRPPPGQVFFENRKINDSEFRSHASDPDESAKAKAERNIFLQD